MFTFIIIVICVTNTYAFLLDSVFAALKTRVEQLEQALVTNKTIDLQNKYTKLEQEYSILKQEQILFTDKLHASENRTKTLEEEVERLKGVTAINQLQSIDSVQKQMQSMQRDINTLTSQGQARGQDLVALYNDFSQTKNKLSVLDNQQRLTIGNLSRVETMTSILNRNITKWDAVVYDISANLSLEMTNLSKKQNETESKVQTALHQITEDRNYGFTAFGASYGTKSARQIIKFPDIKSSFGLTNLSTFGNTGEFVCEKSGIYLISVTMMSKSQNKNEGFYILKNMNEVGQYYIGQIHSGSTSYALNSGSGTTLVQLNKGDTISVTTIYDIMFVYDYWSSITVMKIN